MLILTENLDFKRLKGTNNLKKKAFFIISQLVFAIINGV